MGILPVLFVTGVWIDGYAFFISVIFEADSWPGTWSGMPHAAALEGMT